MRLHQALGTCWCGSSHSIEAALELNRAETPALPTASERRAGLEARGPTATELRERAEHG